MQILRPMTNGNQPGGQNGTGPIVFGTTFAIVTDGQNGTGKTGTGKTGTGRAKRDRSNC